MKLNNTCDFFNGKGIFTALSNKNLLYIKPENALNLDIDFYLTYGNRETSPLVDYLLIDNKLTDESQNRLADIILNRFKSNWDRLDLAFNKEYNPIWNKDGTETTTVTNSGREVTFEKGEQSNTFNKGEQSNTFNKGEQTNTFNKGQQTNTFNKGEESNTNDYGVEVETVTNGATRQTNTLGTETETNSNGEQVTDYSEKVTNVSNGERKSITENTTAAFNSNTYEKNNKTDVTDNASVDKTTENAHTVTNKGYTDTITKSGREDSIVTDEVTNTTNKSAHTDILTNSSREDNTIEGERADSSKDGSRIDTSVDGSRTDRNTEGIRTDITTEGENTITTTNIYGGNIGVTSTQELLTQEFELRNKYNFYDIIFKNVQSVLTDGYYNY